MAERSTGNSELSLVAPGTVIEGKVRTEGSIRVDGKIVGDLVSKADAAVGATGVVEGTVMAKNITLAGKVNGTVTATDKLILEGKSVLNGDIRASRLVVDEGAMFDGQCAMTNQPGTSKSGSQRE